MAATIIGTIATNDHKVQKQDFNVDRSGLITLRERWLINEADMFGAIPAFQTAHDDFSYLFFQSAALVTRGTGLMVVDAVYQGAVLGGGGTTTTPFYSLQTGLMAVPITQHPNVSTWIGTETTAGRDPRDSAGLFRAWKLGAVSSGSQSLYGVDSYEVPTAIWTKEWVSNSAASSSDLALLGKIDTPTGSPPTPTNSNWLCIEVSSRDISSGMVQRVTRWKLSQVNAGGGWNSDIY